MKESPMLRSIVDDKHARIVSGQRHRLLDTLYHMDEYTPTFLMRLTKMRLQEVNIHYRRLRRSGRMA